MYYAIGVSVSSLHRESTDSPIQCKCLCTTDDESLSCCLRVLYNTCVNVHVHVCAKSS